MFLLLEKNELETLILPKTLSKTGSDQIRRTLAYKRLKS